MADSARVRREGRAITSGDREMLYQLIHEEADKLFGDTGIAEKKRKTVEGAVKITIDASIPEDESASSKDDTPGKSRS